MINIINKIKFASVIIITLITSIICGTSAQAVECKAPKLSTEQIIEIVRRERAVRTDLPKEIPDSTKNVYLDERCYYTYHESGKDVAWGGRVFILNEDGVIVDILLHHAETTMKCPAPHPSLNFLADRLKLLREQEPTLARPPQIAYTTYMTKVGCAFYYTEETDDEASRKTFLFDVFGGLMDYMSP